jgi:hypothetical protein
MQISSNGFCSPDEKSLSESDIENNYNIHMQNVRGPHYNMSPALSRFSIRSCGHICKKLLSKNLCCSCFLAQHKNLDFYGAICDYCHLQPSRSAQNASLA